MARLLYTTVGSNMLDEAKAFYDALFASVGIFPQHKHPSGGQLYGKDGKICFGVLGPFNREPATAGNGTMIAFHMNSREEVNAFHAKALALGGVDEGAPGERGPSLYMSYFRDLDGNKLCGCFFG